MRNTSRQLPYRLHFLCLQERRLCLLPRDDFGSQPFVGNSELLSAVRYHTFELFSVARQRGSGVAERLSDLIQFGHSAEEWTQRTAASMLASGEPVGPLLGGVPELDQVGHSAEEWTQRFAARQNACGSRKGLD